MEHTVKSDLSRRERQIMDVVYRLESATAAEVQGALPDASGLNSVRRLISILEEKGHLSHQWDGPRHVYSPVVPRKKAGKSALEHLKTTFFKGSAAHAMAALFEENSKELSAADLELLAEKIEQAKQNNQ